MTTFTEVVHPFEFLLSESPGQYSRDNATLVSGQNLGAGSVLGKISASGKYAVYNNSGSDGTQTAVAILCEAVNASAADQPCAIISRDAEVKGSSLVWPSTGSPTVDKPAGIVDLAAVGIIVR
jgi:Bacteriophage lambda head decoration protein D